jgi:hypothetical protein
MESFTYSLISFFAKIIAPRTAANNNIEAISKGKT